MQSEILICRNTSRAIILKFNVLDSIVFGKEKVKIFQRLKSAQNEGSSLVGQLIHLAASIYTQESFEMLNRTVSVRVSEILGHCLPRLSETYPIWLYSMSKVRCT